MLAMIVELNRQQCELYTILEKKDQEIGDYRESGVALSRSKFVHSHCIFTTHAPVVETSRFVHRFQMVKTKSTNGLQ